MGQGSPSSWPRGGELHRAGPCPLPTTWVLTFLGPAPHLQVVLGLCPGAVVGDVTVLWEVAAHRPRAAPPPLLTCSLIIFSRQLCLEGQPPA